MVRGLLGGILDRISGPNLPHSGKLDLEAVHANLGRISQIPDQAARTEQLSTQANDIISRHSLFGSDQSQVYKDKEVGSLLANKYLTPQARADFLARLNASFQSPKEQLELAKQREELGDESYYYGVSARGGAPPESRTQESPPATAPPDERAIKEGREAAAPDTQKEGFPAGKANVPEYLRPNLPQAIPEAKKTPQMRISDQYNPQGLDAFLGPPPPRPFGAAFLKAHPPNLVWMTSPDGTKTTALESRGQNFIQEAGTGRILNANAARAAGWQISAERPIQPPHPLPRYAIDPKTGKGYQTDYNPSTRRYEFSKGEDGQRILVKLSPEQVDNSKMFTRMYSTAVAGRDKYEKDVEKKAADKLAQAKVEIEAEVGIYRRNPAIGEKPRTRAEKDAAIRVATEEFNGARDAAIKKNEITFEHYIQSMATFTGMSNALTQIRQQPPDEPESSPQADPDIFWGDYLKKPR
jgi:hypothetical protein